MEQIKLPKPDRERLIADWIVFCNSEEGSEEYERSFWAFDQMCDWLTDDPEQCWETILAILEHTSDDKALANLAAGPLESLLSDHRLKFIERVEERSRQDAKFRWLLGGVWKNMMPDDVWERLQAVAGERW